MRRQNTVFRFSLAIFMSISLQYDVGVNNRVIGCKEKNEGRRSQKRKAEIYRPTCLEYQSCLCQTECAASLYTPTEEAVVLKCMLFIDNALDVQMKLREASTLFFDQF